jgi:hypothetical protein
MNLPPEMLAELQAEHDWILWKMEEDKKSGKTGISEYTYCRESGEYQEDVKRLKEIKLLLKPVKSIKSEC